RRSSNCQSASGTDRRSSDCPSASRRPEHSSKKSLAMAYVPWQKFEDLYPNDAALSKGTLFCQLDLPFRGRR
ncbi:MAG: spore coat associated protein CotJA, partial [Lachnospiraceae bacterium]|nr:spore coat associated protein CotJA [Lachnospiraceae bacterium]